MSRPRRERGVALLTAIVLVALATMLAVAIGFASAMSARRSAALFAVEQGLEFGHGAEALAAYVLAEDEVQVDLPTDAWSQPYGPVEIAPGVSLEAVIQAEQGRFNLNTLLTADGTPDADALKVFTRLLEILELEPRWAGLVLDWLDANTLPVDEGGEDSLYTAQDPPYLAANLPVTSISELQSLPGFGRERYLKLAPHVTALPPGERRIDVCLASGAVIDALFALSEGGNAELEYSQLPAEELARSRAGACFPSRQVLRNRVGPKADAWLSETSSYFRLSSWISIGTTRFSLYSLMYRDARRQVRPVVRTFGTE